MFERFYKESSDFVYVRISSEIDDDGFLEHMLAYNQEAKERKGIMELCDCRDVSSTTNFTVQMCAECGKLDARQNRVIGGKLAILVSEEFHYGMARAFEMFANEGGRKVEIFYEFDKAIDFLNIKESITEIVEFLEGIECT